MAGFALAMWTRRRIFYRTSEFGVQVFNSFLHMTFARLIDWVLALTAAVLFAGGLLVACGGIYVWR